MNVLIFAAGLGTRLKPLTDTMPKALVPVKGQSLLSILIEKIKRQMEDMHIVINIHHFADQIKRHVIENESYGVDIQFSDETDQLLDTGGGLKKALPLFPNNSPILIHNVDILSNVNLKDFYNRFSGAVTLMVSKRETTRYLLADETDKLVGWTNVNTGEIRSPYKNLNVAKCRKYAFSGIHIVSPSILKPYLDQWQGKFSIVEFYLSVCDKIDIQCEYNPNLKLVDVGKLDTLNNLQNQNLEELL